MSVFVPIRLSIGPLSTHRHLWGPHLVRWYYCDFGMLLEVTGCSWAKYWAVMWQDAAPSSFTHVPSQLQRTCQQRVRRQRRDLTQEKKLEQHPKPTCVAAWLDVVGALLKRIRMGHSRDMRSNREKNAKQRGAFALSHLRGKVSPKQTETNGCSWSISWTHAMAQLGRQNLLLQLMHLLPRRRQCCTAGCLSQLRTLLDEFRDICLQQLKMKFATRSGLNIESDPFLGSCMAQAMSFQTDAVANA